MVPLKKFLAGRNVYHVPWLPRECRRLSELPSPTAINAIKLWNALNIGQLAPPISPLAPPRGLPFVHSWGTPPFSDLG